MSKMKKKTNKTMRLSVLAASLMMLTPVTHSAETYFSPKPLVGVSEEFAPHVVLALSVEFPTAGAAYFGETSMDVSKEATTKVVTTSYLGYFDNKKCYKYNHSGQYFYPSSMAQDKLCNNGSEKEEFSGNMLNYMTMSAIDIFRSAMTGGNRAMGTGSERENYTNADTPTDTYLRRANVVATQNGLSAQRLRERVLKPFWNLNATGNAPIKANLYRLLPHGYVDFAMQDALKNKHREGDPRSLGYEMAQKVVQHANITNPAEQIKPGELAGPYDKFVTHDLFFINDGFTVTLARKVVRQRKLANGTYEKIISHYSNSNPVYFEYFAVYKPQTHRIEASKIATSSDWKVPTTSEWNEQWAKPLNVVVKVCENGNSLQRETNCKQYGNNYKPEGLLQQYAAKGIRVATMGYLNIAGNNVHGGVLRSRMKQLINDPEKTATQFKDEWNVTTGILEPNPDEKDAEKTGSLGETNTISNSGAINYLNKFGDRSGYKTNDPGAELYYTALAYLRGLKNVTPNKGNTTIVPYKPGTTGQIAETQLTAAAKDGFPTIYDWDDPFTRGIDPSRYQCHQNSIIYIGDTNTHGEKELPGFYDTAGSPAADGIQTKSYLERVLANESNPFEITKNIGAGNSSPAGIVGLAYWARVNDIRPDIPGTQNGNNFMVDVLESNRYKAGENSYYLAAKYGGFSRTTKDGKATNGNDRTTELANKALPDQRWMWTDDKQGITSIKEFTDGVPRNFAVANNPDTMVTALEKAMSVGTATGNPTQAGTGLSVNSGDVVDFSSPTKPVVLQSTYNFAQLTGDIIAYNATYNRSADSNSYFTRSEKWRASEGLEQYRTAYTSRKLFTIRGNTVYNFQTDGAAIFNNVPMLNNATVQQLTDYVLGSDNDENRVFRKRSSLMGTVINSTVMPIVKVGDNAPDRNKCTYEHEQKVRGRAIHYAAAANDGILHIVDADGQPVAGYMAGIAVDKLPDFADRNYSHQYLNDGTPVVAEVCMGEGRGKAKSILIGTTGRGGAAVYALDVTDMSTFGKNNVLWEFSVHNDSNLGYTISKPVITKSPSGKPLAIVSSGYNNASNIGHIFILDISKPSGDAWAINKNYWKIPLGGSGVGAPFVYDKDNDGVADKIFVGDLDGKLWQLNRNESATTTGVSWSNPYGSAPLFAPSSNAQPITGAPYADTASGKLMVVVGTGKYFTETDLNKTQQNYAYGFIVDDKTTITEANLLQQQIITTPLTGENVKLDKTKTALYSVTEHTMTEQHKGWRLQLLQGQLIAANALIRSKQAAEFSAVRLTDNANLQCQRSGATSYISVDINTGGLHKQSIFDSNNDGKVDSSDTRAAMYEALGVLAPNVTTMNVSDPSGETHLLADINDGGGGSGGDALVTDTSQHIKLGNFDAVKGVRRISWREIF